MYVSHAEYTNPSSQEFFRYRWKRKVSKTTDGINCILRLGCLLGSHQSSSDEGTYVVRR